MSKDVMRSYSVTVTVTPRQAVALLRAAEYHGIVSEESRAFAARHRVMVGMWDAGWRWEDDTETWRLDTKAVRDQS